MAKLYEVRVREGWRWNTVRSAGREFVKSEPTLVRATEAGAPEILACPHLEAVEVVPEPEKKPRRRSRRSPGGGDDVVAKTAE